MYTYLQLDDGSIIKMYGHEIAGDIIDCVTNTVSFERYRQYREQMTPNAIQVLANRSVQFGFAEQARFFVNAEAIPQDWAISAAIRYGHFDSVREVLPYHVPTYRAPLATLKEAKEWGHKDLINWLHNKGHVDEAVWAEFTIVKCKACVDGYYRVKVLDGCYAGQEYMKACPYCDGTGRVQK